MILYAPQNISKGYLKSLGFQQSTPLEVGLYQTTDWIKRNLNKVI